MWCKKGAQPHFFFIRIFSFPNTLFFSPLNCFGTLMKSQSSINARLCAFPKITPERSPQGPCRDHKEPIILPQNYHIGLMSPILSLDSSCVIFLLLLCAHLWPSLTEPSFTLNTAIVCLRAHSRQQQQQNVLWSLFGESFCHWDSRN